MFTPLQVGIPIRRFGVTASNPSVITTASNILSFFEQPQQPTFSNQDAIQPFAGASDSGTADSFSQLGYKAMPRLLLNTPSPGLVPSFATYCVAGGEIIIPNSAVNPAVNIVLNQNYFKYQGQQIAVTTNTLSTLATAAPLSIGTTDWSMFFSMTGGRAGLIGGGTFVIGGVTYPGVVATTAYPKLRPTVNLSLAMQFSGSPGGSNFQATLAQFEIQIIGPKNLVNPASI